MAFLTHQTTVISRYLQSLDLPVTFKGLDVQTLIRQLGWALFLKIFATYGAFKLLNFVYDELTSPLRDLPGPPSKSFLYGNFKEIREGEIGRKQEEWAQKYGNTIMLRGIFGGPRLCTMDLKAMSHILTNNYIYQKSERTIYSLKRLMGEGVLAVEGDTHKRQRRILNPAFGPQQIRELTEIFVEKSLELRDSWNEEIAKQTLDGRVKVDALSWLSRATLDVIGLAGFNYRFDALSDGPGKNELSNAFASVFKAGSGVNIIPLLRRRFKWLRWLPAESDAEVRTATATMKRIGNQILEDSKAALADGGHLKNAGNEKNLWQSRNLLSLLVRANTMPDLSENQRLSDEDVLAQMSTFLVAGHETTSTATTWALFVLSQHPAIQSALRSELATISTDNPSMDDLSSLPYLDAVVRETLRLYPPVPSTARVAMQDDVIPLATPFVDRKGVERNQVHIRKGQVVLIPIVTINCAKLIWGEDAMEFKPERWANLSDTAGAVPGVWGNMMTFLGGPRACIGYRFSLVEMKALLFTLIRAFEFELAVPAKDIIKRAGMVQRPVLMTDPEKSNQLPLFLRPVAQ
ncbi:unnamed protein product [Cyclocybe aegerita]|uniref:Cytochrome P450 n=1 Tax=Cyclocybe aegerita TaxID=1973307 RepID=A0A8S0VXK5_CYCAE|nr:unnamed protein product [Cyclocybe aegerita]